MSLLRELPGPTETPTALLGQEHHKTWLVAPFHDIYQYSRYFLVLGIVTHYNPGVHYNRESGLLISTHLGDVINL